MRPTTISSAQWGTAGGYIQRPLSTSQKLPNVLSISYKMVRNIEVHCYTTTITLSRPGSVRDPGRILQLKVTPINCVMLSAMSHACVCRFHVLRHKAVAALPVRRKCVSGIPRSYSTSTSLVTSSSTQLIIHSPAPVVVAAQLTPFNTTQRSEEWFALRRDKLTTSTFSTALGFWKGNRRSELWHEKVFTLDAGSITAAGKAAMEWGVLNESAAIEQYKSITGRDVSSLGFAVHAEEQSKWLGASPDGLLGCCPEGGILEVKCPYNKGKPELALPWSTMPFYYMPQVQGQMEVMDRDWVDLYCWTQNGSTIIRVCRDHEYWELIHGILREFWWENVVPAREGFLLGKEEDVRAYRPSPTHKQTGLVINKSIKLAAEANLICREIAGHTEFYR